MIIVYKTTLGEAEYGIKDEVCRRCTAPECKRKFNRANCLPVVYSILISIVLVIILIKIEELTRHHMESKYQN